jgi:hypothetical protein
LLSGEPFLLFALELFDEAGGGPLELRYRLEAGGWSEGAVDGVEDDVLYGFLGDGVRPGPGEVEAGDLEAVEKEPGAAEVDFVGCEALDDFADGVLDGAAVLGYGYGEVGNARFASGEVGGRRGAAGGVVVVAEGLAAQAGAAAAAAVDVDVAALEAGIAVRLGAVVGCVELAHDVVPSPGVFCGKVRLILDLGPDREGLDD